MSPMDKKCIDVKRFIFTGTPGSGKTSVIKELKKLGYAVIFENLGFIEHNDDCKINYQDALIFESIVNGTVERQKKRSDFLV
jgi:predicted ATPase